MSQRCLCNIILTCIQRSPLYKAHYEVALARPSNTGFNVHMHKYTWTTARFLLLLYYVLVNNNYVNIRVRVHKDYG